MNERLLRIYGAGLGRTFEQAAAKFMLENQHKRSICDDASRLSKLMPFIGQVRLNRLHRGTLEPWVGRRRKDNAAAGTINRGLKVRRILNLAATEWIDEHGLTWLQTAPKIRLLPDRAVDGPLARRYVSPTLRRTQES